LRRPAHAAGVLNDPDTYLHIAAGRWMIAHGAAIRSRIRCRRRLPPRFRAVAVLDHLPGWRRAYADRAAVIDVRIDKKP
jgi:hypothetical protein